MKIDYDPVKQETIISIPDSQMTKEVGEILNKLIFPNLSDRLLTFAKLLEGLK